MTEAAVLLRLNAIFKSVLGLPELSLAPTTVASDVKGWDSISHIDIIVRIEREFGIKFTLREIQSFANVGDLLHLVVKKTNAV